MAVLHFPSGDQRFYDLIRHFRPVGSTTTVWAQDMATDQLVRMLRWGDEIYLPVYDGMKLGIGLYNGDSLYRAYPAYCRKPATCGTARSVSAPRNVLRSICGN